MTAENWILARANCTAAHYFKELVKKIRQDVGRFNRLGVVKKSQKGFKVVEHVNEIAIHPARLIHMRLDNYEWQAEMEPNSDIVSIGYSNSSIHAERSHYWRIEINLKWNIETLSCDLMIEGEPRSLDYISQKLLGEFLFTDLVV